jgi:hypothetical protein
MAQGNVSIYDNDRFDQFRSKLEAKGVILKMMWEAKSERHQNSRKKYDVACYAVVGAPDGGYRGTIMVVSYGDDGFATYWEPGSASMDADVARIMGKEQADGA